MVISQENIPYMEASSNFPSVQRSYADVGKQMFSLPSYTLFLPLDHVAKQFAVNHVPDLL